MSECGCDLCAETQNVRDETGKSPRTLANENDVLRELLAECVEELAAYESPRDPLDSHNVRLGAARSFLSNTDVVRAARGRS